MTVDKVWQEGNVDFVNWHMGAMHATEEFVTRDGKIKSRRSSWPAALGGAARVSLRARQSMCLRPTRR